MDIIMHLSSILQIKDTTQSIKDSDMGTLIRISQMETSCWKKAKKGNLLKSNIRCTHEVYKQTYSWGASALLP